MTESGTPPQTGEPAVDDALSGVQDLADRPLSEHHEHLSRAHEALHEVLDDSSRSEMSEQTGNQH